MGEANGFRENLRRLAIVDEGFFATEAGLSLGTDRMKAMDPRTAGLVLIGASVAMGCTGVVLEWSAGRALAAGATEAEIADVLLAIAPVTGLALVVGAATDLAAALGYDLESVLEGTE